VVRVTIYRLDDCEIGTRILEGKQIFVFSRRALTPVGAGNYLAGVKYLERENEHAVSLLPRSRTDTFQRGRRYPWEIKARKNTSNEFPLSGNFPSTRNNLNMG
jgi:hypothetical protein